MTRTDVFRRKNAPGQGLLEMIIAIGILTTGLLSTMTLTTASLSATKDTETRLVAASLSREGIEVIRSLRDTNWLIGQSWNAGLFGAGNNRTATAVFAPGATAAWTLDFSAQDVDDAAAAVFLGITPGSTTEHLYIQTVGGGMPQGAIPTPYRRLVSLFPICRSDTTGLETVVTGEQAACAGGETEIGVDVFSRVSWSVKRQQHTVTTEEKMYDWR
jgi:Tfp pilus assembly protein PilV